MKRLLKWTFGIVLIGLATWYLALKKEHYQISFTTKQPAGVVFEHLSNWNDYNVTYGQRISNISSKPYSKLLQQVTIEDSIFLYEWDIQKIADGKTKVNCRVTDKQHKWTQKAQIPFIDNAFVHRSISNVKEVGYALTIEGQKFKTHSIKDTLVSPDFCAYIAVTSSIDKKASSMLATIAPIMEYIKGNSIELKGDPFLEVTSWNEAEQTIQYNFCFPIAQSDSIPANKEIQFKTIAPFKALKAEFNGNYRISNKAWYYLLDYAERNQYNVKRLPFEIFLNDPHVGGNPLDWKAHIFLPLED